MMYTRGIGRPPRSASRLTTWCSRCSGPTCWARYMLNTILSENQYDAKFVATANTNPMASPCAPPIISPNHMSSALRTPSSSAVFTTLDMMISMSLAGTAALHGCATLILQAREQTRNERRLERQRFDFDVLVQGVGTVADGAQAVKRRNSQGGGKVAVRAASGAALAQVEPELASNGTRLIVQTRNGGRAFQRRPLETAGNLQPDAPVASRLPANAVVNQLHLAACRRTHI